MRRKTAKLVRKYNKIKTAWVQEMRCLPPLTDEDEAFAVASTLHERPALWACSTSFPCPPVRLLKNSPFLCPCFPLRPATAADPGFATEENARRARNAAEAAARESDPLDFARPTGDDEAAKEAQQVYDQSEAELADIIRRLDDEAGHLNPRYASTLAKVVISAFVLLKWVACQWEERRGGGRRRCLDLCCHKKGGG